MKGKYLHRTRSLMVALLSLSLSFSACKKLIEVGTPIDKITAQTVYSDPSTAMAALAGLYAHLADVGSFVGSRGISFRAGLLSDEITPRNIGAYGEYTNNSLAFNSWELWTQSYRDHLYGINFFIEQTHKSSALSAGLKKQLIAEAKFLRAFVYFYIVNFYGDAPLVLSSDFIINTNIPRSPATTIYAQIIQDLQEAETELNEEYLQNDLVSVSTERIRASRAVASALLARIYLYLEKWEDAEWQATKLITDTRFSLAADLNTVFGKNSTEAIWQLQPNSVGADGPNTPDGQFFLGPDAEPYCYVSQFVFGAFELNDKRKDTWLLLKPSGKYALYKYKEGYKSTTIQKEYTMVFRLAEQYLIRAESRAQLDKISGANSAESDVNILRNRSGLEDVVTTSKSDMLDAIMHERKVELFSEWGHRWFDLKRTNRLDQVMTEVAPVKGASWASSMALLPIPLKEFDYNEALRGHQNPGYPEQP